MSWEGGGIALTGGSANSHVAMLARARGVPMLIGLDTGILQAHGEALLDADNGMVITHLTHRPRLTSPLVNRH